jgi:UDP-GlcNAc:undecaprenyl-phosphate GlcNAc-1-phosphate transferase
MTGGMVIFAVFFVLSFLLKAHFNLLPFLIASLLMVAAGVYDDLKGLGAAQKLLIQFIAAIILMSFGIMITHVKIPFGPVLDIAFFSIPVTIIWFLFISNLVNLLDGLDGLAAGLSLIVFFVLFSIANPAIFGAQLSILIGALSAFLIYNFHPAKIFLGNNGSSFMGFAIGYFSLVTSQKTSILPILVMPVCILMIHVLDMCYSVFRRAKNGQQIFKGDHGHIHHILLKSIKDYRVTVLSFYLIALLLATLILRIFP